MPKKNKPKKPTVKVKDLKATNSPKGGSSTDHDHKDWITTPLGTPTR